jgi:arylsulfatase A-like enzyme
MLTAFLVPGAHAAGEFSGKPHPNIVFVLLDAARADHFTCYGYGKETTPCMDEISRQGVVFLNNYSPATETFNSMPLIFSSRYYSKEIFQKDTWRWGVRRESSPSIFTDYDSEQILLPELLSRNGYRTVIIHDHWWFVPQTDMVKSFDEHLKVKTDLKHRPADEAMVDRALTWMKENRGKPFFIYLHIMSPHQPYPPKVADRLFVKEGESDALDKIRRKFRTKPNESARDWTLEQLAYLSALYDSNLRHSDTQIGRFYSALKKNGLADDTLFIITSDHGENLGDHGALNHGGPPWDSATHIPLIMTCPGRIPAGVRVEGLTESIDIMPTIVDLCGLKLPEGKALDGVSLKQFINNPALGKEAVYTGASIRTPRYKYIIRQNALFNVLSDPGEKIDLASSSPDLAEQLAGKYRRFMKPFKERYKGARRDAAPDYPFFLPLREFSISPRAAFDICAMEKQPIVVMKEINPDKAWVINKTMHNGGLFCLPDRRVPPPMTISIRMPDGTYRASVLVENLGKVSDNPGDVGLESRFEPAGRFLSPLGFKNAAGARFCYLDWGQVIVKNKLFSVELSVRPEKKIPFFLHHVRFNPIDDTDQAAPEVPNKIELKERREGLRSLGYL